MHNVNKFIANFNILWTACKDCFKPEGILPNITGPSNDPLLNATQGIKRMSLSQLSRDPTPLLLSTMERQRSSPHPFEDSVSPIDSSVEPPVCPNVSNLFFRRTTTRTRLYLPQSNIQTDGRATPNATL